MQKAMELNTIKKKTTAPKVAVVIINFNSWGDLNECLPYVLQSDYKNFEIVVVDNASSDDSVKKIRENYKQITLIANTVNTGCGAGNNTGIRYAIKNGFDYVFLLNADIKMTPETLRGLVEAAEKNQKLGLVSPVLNFYYTPDKVQHCGSLIDWKNFKITNLTDLNDLQGINQSNLCLWGTALLVKTEILKRIGLYNEDYFVYCEDDDLSIRAHKAGYQQAILKDIKIFHKAHSYDLKGIKGQPLYRLFYLTRNKYALWKKHADGMHRWKLNLIYFAQVMNDIGYCKEEGLKESMDAFLDGLYCGWTNRMGRWKSEENSAMHMPKILKKIFISRPFLWANLATGKFRDLLTKKLTLKKMLTF